MSQIYQGPFSIKLKNKIFFDAKFFAGKALGSQFVWGLNEHKFA